MMSTYSFKLQKRILDIHRYTLCTCAPSHMHTQPTTCELWLHVQMLQLYVLKTAAMTELSGTLFKCALKMATLTAAASET